MKAISRLKNQFV